MRYFLISYSANLKTSSYHLSKTTIGTSMPSRKELIDEIESNKDIISCYITSIFEFKSKKDYLDFIKL